RTVDLVGDGRRRRAVEDHLRPPPVRRSARLVARRHQGAPWSHRSRTLQGDAMSAAFAIAEPEISAGPSGLDQVRALMDGSANYRGIAHLLDFRPVEAREGFVAFEGHPSRAVYNPIGSVHGGYAATLLDSAMGCAVQTMLKPGQGFTTMELKVAYHKAMSDQSGPVRAEGKV